MRVKILFSLAIMIPSLSCSKKEVTIFREETSFFCMDTKVKIIVTGPDRDTLEKCLKISSENLSYFDSLFGPENIFLTDSPLNPYSFYLWEKSCTLMDITEGAFDPTLGDVMRLWGDFSEETLTLPDSSLLESIIGIRNTAFPVIENGRLGCTPWRTPDLGGIAKGLAVQTTADICESLGVFGVLIEAGGDIAVRGYREDGKIWKIGIQHPRSPGELIAVINLNGKSVCTSGDYQRFIIKNGVRYHHILDPSNLMPSRGIVSATVICEKAEEADALSTAFMILPPQTSRIIADATGADFLLAIETDEGLEFLSSSGFEEYVIEWKTEHGTLD
ncbi:FAD:protein FMN transferase [candidate division WOR-3 bacterium]|nr:FAD:protein FMN transferase [candidate division WOR-3 bacterium]